MVAASRFQRAVARGIDEAIFLLPFQLEYQGLLPNGLPLGLLYFRWFLYYPIVECRGGGIGKRMLGLRTVNPHAYNAAWWRISKKWLAVVWPYILLLAVGVWRLLVEGDSLYEASRLDGGFEALCGFAILIVNLALWSSLSDVGQSYHDRAAGVYVVRASSLPFLQPMFGSLSPERMEHKILTSRTGSVERAWRAGERRAKLQRIGSGVLRVVIAIIVAALAILSWIFWLDPRDAN